MPHTKRSFNKVASKTQSIERLRQALSRWRKSQTFPDVRKAFNHTAILVVDTQEYFCERASGVRGNQQTEKIAARIAATVPRLRDIGIKIFAVYFDIEDTPEKDLDYYLFYPDRKMGDTILKKEKNSAFHNQSLVKRLRAKGIKNILVCGFNLNACVDQTAKSAKRHGFSVTVLKDLVGNDNQNLGLYFKQDTIEKLRKKGIAYEKTHRAIKKIRLGL